MKNKILAFSTMALVFVFMFSCSDSDKSRIDSLAVSTEKKATKPAKKKKRKKSVTPTKRKGVNPSANSKGSEAESASNAENSSAVIHLAGKINKYAALNGYSTKYCFLVDMTQHSGRNRFFVYDLEKSSIIYSGLVAHGSCNKSFLSRPRFSNTPNCGCTSLGKYKVGEFYRGQYGKSFRLYGLDRSNSNAYKRAVVIHGYDCVPNKEIYPRVLCNSLGCVMVSYNFFDKLYRTIEKSEKPIVLWVYG